jgi:hypothetical protein
MSRCPFTPTEQCRDNKVQRNHSGSLGQSTAGPVLKHYGAKLRHVAVGTVCWASTGPQSR